MPPLRVIVCGPLGRMGSRVVELASRDGRFRLVGGVAAEADVGTARGYPLFSERELQRRMPAADVLVDFSTAEASARYAELAARTRTALVTGTTGRTEEQEKAVRAAGRRAPVFAAANFSPGVAVLAALARSAARSLPGWDAAILDLHHAAKKDAPSGTALRLAEAVEQGRGAKPQVVSQRAGDVVGDHTILLAGPDERLELVHRAHSRDVFARGALEAALWLRGRKAGLYGMADMLRLGS